MPLAGERSKRDRIQRVGPTGSRLYRQVVSRIRSIDPLENHSRGFQRPRRLLMYVDAKSASATTHMGLFQQSASVVSQKFVEQVIALFGVIPAKAGIQKLLKF